MSVAYFFVDRARPSFCVRRANRKKHIRDGGGDCDPIPFHFFSPHMLFVRRVAGRRNLAGTPFVPIPSERHGAQGKSKAHIGLAVIFKICEFRECGPSSIIAKLCESAPRNQSVAKVRLGSTPVIENSEPNFRKGSEAAIRGTF